MSNLDKKQEVLGPDCIFLKVACVVNRAMEDCADINC